MSEMSDIRWKNLVVGQGLKTMFQKEYFDVCLLDSMAATIGGTLPSQMKDAFRVLHCVHYTDMHPDIRAELPRRVVQALALCVQIDVEDIVRDYQKQDTRYEKDITPAPEKSGFLKLLYFRR